MSAIRVEARKLGGEASVETNPGQGTCLTVIFPLREKHAMEPNKKPGA